MLDIILNIMSLRRDAMKDLKCNDVTLSTDKPLVCVSITGANLREIKEQTKKIKRIKPDIVEWRADCLKIEDEKSEIMEIAYALTYIHKRIKKYPLIFTFRNSDEGGKRRITFDKYKEMIHYICLEGIKNKVQLVDVEAYNKRDLDGMKELLDDIHSNGLKVLGSYHNFNKTPSKEELTTIFTTMEQMGCDIAKIAVMPQGKGDVYAVIGAATYAYENLSVPTISIAMGELGSITRVALKQTHSVLTFASLADDETFKGELRQEDIEKMNALGQLPYTMAKKLVEVNMHDSFDGNISIVGYMGTGKTTVSKALAMILNREVIDTDQYIESDQGKTIKEMFDIMSEEQFRDIETDAVGEISKNKGIIISCGGGAVLRKQNADMLKASGKVVRLNATPETIFERVSRRSTRPLLNNNMTLEYVKEMMDKRELAYREAADVTINVDSNNRVLTCYYIVSRLGF